MCGRCAYKLTRKEIVASYRLTRIRYNECPTTNIDTIVGNDENRLFVWLMGFYQDQIVPLLINWSMRQKDLAARIIPAAEA